MFLERKLCKFIPMTTSKGDENAKEVVYRTRDERSRCDTEASEDCRNKGRPGWYCNGCCLLSLEVKQRPLTEGVYEHRSATRS